MKLSTFFLSKLVLSTIVSGAKNFSQRADDLKASPIFSLRNKIDLIMFTDPSLMTDLSTDSGGQEDSVFALFNLYLLQNKLGYIAMQMIDRIYNINPSIKGHIDKIRKAFVEKKALDKSDWITFQVIWMFIPIVC